MLHVEHGPFAALEAAFLERLNAAAGKSVRGPVAVVAPSRAMADRLERLAAVEGGLSLLDVRFHTFYSLALSIVDDSGWPGLELVADPVFHDKIVDGLLEKAGTFSAGGRRPRALASAVRSSLRDLIDAGIDAAALSEHFEGGLLGDPAERRRLETLLGLMQAYEGRLRGLGILSSSGLTRLAAERAPQSALLGRLEAALYYGFYDLTGLQLSFFQAVAARCETTLFFPYRRGHPAFRFADDFFEQNLGAASSKKELAARHEATALGPALDRLFSSESAPSPQGKSPAISFINASGARDEVWACAKEILRLVEQEGVSCEDIGVVARTLEPYRAALEDVFAENQIPLTLNAGQPLLRHPLAKNALNLLSLRRQDFPAALVAELVGSPYFKAEGAGRSIGRWRRDIARLGVKAGWLQWQAKLEGRLAEEPALEPFWRLLSGWREELGPAGARPTWSELSRRARALLERHFELPARPSADEAAAWQAVMAAVDSLALFDRLGLPASWPDFLDALEEKLRRQALEPTGRGRGVRARGVMDARGETFKYLFLIGLKEKNFPRQVQEDPLLRDSARAALRHPAGYWIGRKAAGYDEERLLFYLAVSSATRGLVCVYPRSDEDGKAEVPSLYLRELCRACGVSLDDEAVNRRVWRQPAERLARCDFFLLSPKEASLRLALAGLSSIDYLKAAGRPAGSLDQALGRLTALGSLGRPGPWDGLIGTQPRWIKELTEKGLSPSALEELATCPFQFFAHRLLGLGSEEDPAEKGELASWALGRFYHEIMERFYRDLPEEVWTGKAPFQAALDRTLEEFFDTHTWKELGVYPVLWQAERESMTETLREFVAWDLADLRAKGLRPRFFELDLEGTVQTRLKLRGRLDRLDLGEAPRRFRVVDYKLQRKKTEKLSKFVDSGELQQLPVYAELAQERLGPAAEFVGADLLSLRDSPERTGRPRLHHYSPEDWRRQRDSFFAAAASRIQRAADGEFPIKPEDDDFGHCRFCDFPALCRKGHGPSRRRAAALDQDE